MTDIAEGQVPEAPVAEVPDAPVDTPAAEADPFDSGADSFDRSYVERLRKEAANYRTKAKEYEERYKPWDEALADASDEEQQAARDLIAAMRTDPDEAKQFLMSYYGLSEAQADAATQSVEGETQYLTPADLERILEERESKRSQQEAIAAIESEAKALGYNPAAEQGSEAHERYMRLAYIANYKTNGDLKAAHEALEAERKSIIESYIAEKARDGGLTVPPQAGGAPSGEKEIASYDDGLRAAKERFGLRAG